MPKPLESTTQLRQWRDEASNGRGLSSQYVADELVRLINSMGVNEKPKTYAWILRIEERGTKDRYIVKGLAKIYNKPEEEIAAAALPLVK